jgi:hypothetical protein
MAQYGAPELSDLRDYVDTQAVRAALCASPSSFS